MTSTGRTFTKEFLGGLATDIRNLIDTAAFPTRLKAKQLEIFNATGGMPTSGDFSL